MDVALILSSVALGISVLVSAIKLADSWVHTDPRSLIRAGRWLLYLVAFASIPALILSLVYQEWALAMTIGAGILFMSTLLNWRAILPRAKFRPAWIEDEHVPPAWAERGPPPDSELVRRALIVLDDYLAHAGELDERRRQVERDQPSQQQATMDAAEALAILGLEPGAKSAAIRAAHRRLVQLVHPDRGGSNYLAAKINLAKDTLLAAGAPKSGVSKRSAGRAETSRYPMDRHTAD